MISNSEDVYVQLVEHTDENWLLGLVAYAIVEEQRIEWMRHREETKGQAPDAVEIQNWYEQQPEGVVLRAKGTAENALKLYADDVLQEALEVERKEVADGVVVSEIRLLRRFWPQFGINLAAGMASAILFAAVLAVLAFFVFIDPSPVKFGMGAAVDQTKDNANGKTNDRAGSE